MVHSVELVFDTATEAAVRNIWAALTDNGIPAQAPSSRPHATLTVADRIDGRVDALLAPLTERLPLPCLIGAPLIFGRAKAVLARLVIPSIELLDLHAEVYRRCLPHLTPAPMPHTAPGQWTGHVTLARRIGPRELARAVQLAARPAEIAGTVVALRHWDGERRVEQLIG
ncbi:2'-5' RNA ligase family protein [Mycolicibacterium thermoresistibile]